MANNYPNWAAGDPITAANLNYTQGQVIVKTSGTQRASTTTLADDPDLTVTLDANATYFVEAWLHFVSPTTEGIKTAWTTPSGASGNRLAFGEGSTQSASNADNVSGRFGVHGFGTSVTYGDRASNTTQCAAIETAIVTTSSSGTLAVQWAQATSGANAAEMSAGSCLRVKRVA